ASLAARPYHRSPSPLLTPTVCLAPAVPAPPEFSAPTLHDALPICLREIAGAQRRQRAVGQRVVLQNGPDVVGVALGATPTTSGRSEEHTSELQSRFDLVCRLLLEKTTA